MKNPKIMVFGTIFIFIGTIAFAQSITVDEPHSGDVWYKTKFHTIKWTKSGGMDAKVKIRLLNSAGTAKILSITNSTPNDHMFEWKIPATVSTGYYRIRIKTLDNAVHDDSDIFEIKSSSYLPEKHQAKTARPALVGKKIFPDFFIENMTLSPRTPTVFQNTTFKAVIKNTFPHTTPQTYGELAVYAHYPPSGDLKTHQYKFNIPAIQTNKTYTYQKVFSNQISGKAYIIFKIDTPNLVRNENEDNNSKKLDYNVQPFNTDYKPSNVAVTLKKKHGDTDFADHGPKVKFRGEIYITQDGKKLIFSYWMNARETKSDWTEMERKGFRVLYRIHPNSKAIISSFAGGYKKVVYNYQFTFGERGKGSKDMHGWTISPDRKESIGNGTKNPMDIIYFMGNNPKKEKPIGFYTAAVGLYDYGYCGFEIAFNRIDLALDGSNPNLK